MLLKMVILVIVGLEKGCGGFIMVMLVTAGLDKIGRGSVMVMILTSVVDKAGRGKCRKKFCVPCGSIQGKRW